MQDTNNSEGVSTETNPTQTTGATETQQTQDTTQAQPSPTAETLQREQELQARLAQAEQSARYFQSQFDKAQHAVRALTGNQPQPQELSTRDKLSAYYKQKGFNPEDVLPVVDPIINDLVDPLMRRVEQMSQQLAAQNVFQSSTQQINEVLGQVSSDMPEVFVNPAIAQKVQQSVNNLVLSQAQQGQTLDAETLRDFAMRIAWQEQGQQAFEARKSGKSNQPVPAQNRNIPGFFGVQQGFQPQPQQQAKPQMTEWQQKLSADFKEIMGTK